MYGKSRCLLMEYNKGNQTLQSLHVQSEDPAFNPVMTVITCSSPQDFKLYEGRDGVWIPEGFLSAKKTVGPLKLRDATETADQ